MLYTACYILYLFNLLTKFPKFYISFVYSLKKTKEREDGLMRSERQHGKMNQINLPKNLHIHSPSFMYIFMLSMLMRGETSKPEHRCWRNVL